ncbi:putative 50S ribosomal protein L3, chloroplastic-like [Capsicum annuum]|uniref:Uncharacterized protein n=1 Tax=Capsicum annuum TaxID=4072 RepID=A0A1U8FIF5_CAPAN|nr:protein SSUH2 homolog [Capsicum annuum]KAF3636794.1 putative 50S ribosomal protein L3, chloroplastic-like [Capsicum annuum]PHT84057.1 hypothetical protein T459_12500 [Capsicum annuum]
MGVIRLTCFLTSTIRGEAPNLSNPKVPPPPPPPPPLSVSKPCWVVRTESNVRKVRRKQPDPPCVVCKGTGRAKCYHCHGRGRTNFVDLEVLPRGEWPKWCKTCGGSGLGYCSRCLGTGEYRYIMGFHFMRREQDDDSQL